MSKSNTFENDLMKLIFQGAAIANLADNAASAPLTSLYLSLHTADPGEAGNQETNEATYTDYARVATDRDSDDWTITDNAATLVSTQSFPQASGGTETITHFAVGTASTGTGKILYSGIVVPNIAVSTGITPQLGTGTTITED